MAEREPVFEPVRPHVSFPRLEEEILRFWKEREIFRRSVEQREGAEPFVFFEGPPTANGKPGVHHVLARAFKDLIPRYQTMKGRYVLRRGGWDTHGLPVELEVEKELGLKHKREVEAYGIAAFNARCKESVFRYVKEWERLTERIAFWVDLDSAYITYDPRYIETVWWILRTFWDRGLLYQDYKVAMHCPRCDTSLADHEVALGFKEDVEDPSVWVTFPVTEDPEGVLEGVDGVAFVAWTTTPWTLPANAALAVKPDAEYVLAEVEGKGRFVVAAALADATFGEGAYRVLRRFRGEELAGIRYEPLYRGVLEDGTPVDPSTCYRVVTDEFVSLEEGTGIVHIAPAYGDLEIGRKNGLPVLFSVNRYGEVVEAFPKFAGMYFKEADEAIQDDLEARGRLLRRERVRHNYPFCWRCGTPLLYFAKTSWYIRTSQFKDRMVELNRTIRWVPEHIRDGRFGNWLENNVDWALSRERYWGIPLPIWTCQGCGHRHCVGSFAELEEMSGGRVKATAPDFDPHRPFVDEVVLSCPKCGGEMRRSPEVIDVWFDSGAMPYGQWHYPFENQEVFRQQFPADFICEAVDQTRGWFYTLHAIATLLFDSVAFKNVICLGLVLDEEGQKMSKSKGNVVDPWEVIERHGADAMRWYLYTATQPGNNRRFSVDLVGEAKQRFLSTLWNVYTFFVTYANADGFHPDRIPAPAVEARPLLDRWLLSRLHGLIAEVDDRLAHYDVTTAGRALDRFVDELSNWYVRRARRRFWASEWTEDKRAAFHTLYEALVALAHLLAPFVPFTAEALYRNLVARVRPDAPESVHLADWPQARKDLVDRLLEERMAAAMQVVQLGRAARKEARIRVRQPLATLLVSGPETVRAAVGDLADEIAAELNVKEVRWLEGGAAELYDVRLKPNFQVLGPFLGKRTQAVAQLIRNHPNPAELAARLEAGEPVHVEDEGTYVVLPDGAVEVERVPKEGFAVAEEKGILVALDTRLTPELVREGRARDLVRWIQEARKQAGLEVSDRIRLRLELPPEWQEALEAFHDYVAGETLAVEVTVGAAGEGAFEAKADGGVIRIGVERV